MKSVLLSLGVAYLVCPAGPVQAAQGPVQPAKAVTPPVIRWEIDKGVQSPESAYFDPASEAVFVSSIGGGGPAGKDGDGFISKLSIDGKVLQARWITGLNAPKGMRSGGGLLWVADVDRLLGIDAAAGKIRTEVEIPCKQFLNDVACDARGAVYVSDTFGGRILRYEKGKVSVVAEGPYLEGPNGLVVQGDRLIVAGWGPSVVLNTPALGRLYELNTAGRDQRLITFAPLGNLDGLEPLGAGYLVSDWTAGKVYCVLANGKARLLLQLPQGTADLGYVPQARLVIVPQMLQNKVTAYDLGTTR